MVGMFTDLASEDSIQKTKQALEAKGYMVSVFDTGGEALQAIKDTIPPGSSVMNGSSVTLEQIGYTDFLKSGTHAWIDLKAAIMAENDPVRRAHLRKEATLSDFYLGSVHALTQQGELIIASNTGSQLPQIVFSSSHLILVISTKKIVKDLETGMKRLREHVVPLEDKHMLTLYGTHTALNKIVIINGEAKSTRRILHLFLIREDLGF